jgi:iron complex outermembrane receptor protein
VTTDTGFNVATVSHDNHSWALFAHNTLELAESWELSTGVRYTVDKRDFHAPGVKLDKSAYETSWDVGLNYAFNPSTTVYARVAEGFRAPTIQGRDVAFGGPPSVADSETIYAYEIGLKSVLFENRLRLNAAAFYYTVDGFQLSAIGGASNSNRILNADKAVGQGVEFDIEAVPTPNLKLTAGFSYNHTEIHDANLYTAVCGSQQCTPTDPLNINGAAGIDGNPFPGAPETTADITARYQIDHGGDGVWYVFVDWAYQGETNLALYESKEFVVDGQFELGMRVGYESTELGYGVAIFGRNITDEDNVKGFVDFNNNTGFVNDPRVVGVELSYRF